MKARAEIDEGTARFEQDASQNIAKVSVQGEEGELGEKRGRGEDTGVASEGGELRKR